VAGCRRGSSLCVVIGVVLIKKKKKGCRAALENQVESDQVENDSEGQRSFLNAATEATGVGEGNSGTKNGKGRRCLFWERFVVVGESEGVDVTCQIW